MASSQRKTLRFAVGTPTEYRSAVWRLWVQGNDIYLAARTTVSLIKLSLHRSGTWRLAWTESSGIRARHSADRVEERWERPPEFRSGWTQGPSLIVPNTGLKKPFDRPAGGERVPVIWSATPSAGSKHHFTILLASRDAPVESWDTVFRADDHLLGTLDQRNGHKVALCRREVPMIEKESSYIYGFAADMKINYPEQVPDACEASVFTAGTDDAGHPYILDIPLAWENVRGHTNGTTGAA